MIKLISLFTKPCYVQLLRACYSVSLDWTDLKQHCFTFHVCMLLCSIIADKSQGCLLMFKHSVESP